MSDGWEGKDLKTALLWDAYGALLTETQREITDLYFNYDLSLAEIAEQKGVSRQSVSDCLGKSRKLLEEYEKKIGVCFSFGKGTAFFGSAGKALPKPSRAEGRSWTASRGT